MVKNAPVRKLRTKSEAISLYSISRIDLHDITVNCQRFEVWTSMWPLRASCQATQKPETSVFNCLENWIHRSTSLVPPSSRSRLPYRNSSILNAYLSRISVHCSILATKNWLRKQNCLIYFGEHQWIQGTFTGTSPQFTGKIQAFRCSPATSPLKIPLHIPSQPFPFTATDGRKKLVRPTAISWPKRVDVGKDYDVSHSIWYCVILFHYVS